MITPALLISQNPRAPKVPKRKHDRVILHFDYDCFYASVFENEHPALRALPLGIKQKSILATCNYVARARGVKKLMSISEAQKICPDIVLMNGEDLTRFRDASKKLWLLLRSYSWNKRVERLGLDEVWLDASDIIDYNQQLLNPNSLSDSFFQLDQHDPTKGFQFDASSVFGCTQPQSVSSELANIQNPLYVRLMLASHLAGYLRHKLEEYFGYTSTCGVSTNKVLAKLAGTQNKPKNQTTLLSLQDDDIQNFMDAHQLRKIPGLGFKISHLIENHMFSKTMEAFPHDEEYSAKVTTREFLAHPGLSPEVLERVLSGPGSERGIGEKTWNLLHGVDNSEVKEASDIPTQISVEDTYVLKTLNTQAELMRELQSLSTSLIRRMRVDLLDDDPHVEQTGAKKWTAYPKTLRLSTRVKSWSTGDSQARENFNRSSRSQPLPSFVFSLKYSVEQIVERLVSEAILPLFRRLHSDRQGWNLALVNICVNNMVLSGNEAGKGAGRDISAMFKTQDTKLKEFTVYDNLPIDAAFGAAVNEKQQLNSTSATLDVETSSQESGELESMVWETEYGHNCSICGHSIPAFAMPAHERFHALGD